MKKKRELNLEELEVKVAQPGTEVRLPDRTEETYEFELDS